MHAGILGLGSGSELPAVEVTEGLLIVKCPVSYWLPGTDIICSFSTAGRPSESHSGCRAELWTQNHSFKYIFQWQSARNYLTYYIFLHRFYFTLARLARIYRNQSSFCWHCSSMHARFLQIFWECPGIELYWKEVLASTTSVTTIPIIPSIEVCLLSLVDSLVPTNAIRTLLLFFARKLIILSCKKTLTPSLDA